MDIKTKRRLFIASLLTASFLTYYNYDYPYKPTYTITTDDEAFASYSNGKVYIGDANYIKSIKNKVNEDDILVIMGYEDKDSHHDPNASIISSHRITDHKIRYEILCILKEYDNLYHLPWERTIESMRVEWTVHNLLYDLGIEESRTKDVDLDNSEEYIYDNKILKRLIK